MLRPKQDKDDIHVGASSVREIGWTLKGHLTKVVAKHQEGESTGDKKGIPEKAGAGHPKGVGCQSLLR